MVPYHLALYGNYASALECLALRTVRMICMVIGSESQSQQDAAIPLKPGCPAMLQNRLCSLWCPAQRAADSTKSGDKHDEVITVVALVGHLSFLQFDAVVEVPAYGPNVPRIPNTSPVLSTSLYPPAIPFLRLVPDAPPFMRHRGFTAEESDPVVCFDRDRDVKGYICPTKMGRCPSHTVSTIPKGAWHQFVVFIARFPR